MLNATSVESLNKSWLSTQETITEQAKQEQGWILELLYLFKRKLKMITKTYMFRSHMKSNHILTWGPGYNIFGCWQARG